ncbi:helix-turn-helix transcriptional regulator, partial [Empedobacter brevis]
SHIHSHNEKSAYSKKESESTNQLEDLITLAKNDEQAFYTKFHEVYPNFTQNLLIKFPALSTTELRLCSFLKLNFDTKKIAIYTNSSVKSIDSKKYRLRKKLNLSPKDELYSFISRF